MTNDPALRTPGPGANPAGGELPARGAAQRPARGRVPRDAPASPAGPGARPAVNPGLTRRRRQRVTENDQYAQFARRVLRAWARRVAAGDIDAITDMASAARELDDAVRQAVAGLRGKGYSWAEIAARLGVTRQAAQQRWGGHRDAVHGGNLPGLGVTCCPRRGRRGPGGCGLPALRRS